MQSACLRGGFLHHIADGDNTFGSLLGFSRLGCSALCDFRNRFFYLDNHFIGFLRVLAQHIGCGKQLFASFPDIQYHLFHLLPHLFDGTAHVAGFIIALAQNIFFFILRKVHVGKAVYHAGNGLDGTGHSLCIDKTAYNGQHRNNAGNDDALDRHIPDGLQYLCFICGNNQDIGIGAAYIIGSIFDCSLKFIGNYIGSYLFTGF